MRVTAAAVVGLLTIAGCGPFRPGATPVAAAVPLPASVTVQQDRIDAVRGTIEVELTPLDRAYDLTALQLDDPRFERVPATPRRTTVDRLLHLSIDLGDAICPVADDAGATVRLWLPGDPEPVAVPVDVDGDAVLAGIHAAECSRRTVLETVDVRFGDAWASSGHAAARGVVVVTRLRGQDAIVLEGMEGTVIFALTPFGDDDGALAELDRGGSRVEVEVEVSAARCDPHALVESKKTYLFPTWIRVGDAEPVFLTVQPEGRARADLERLLEVGCGLAPTGSGG